MKKRLLVGLGAAAIIGGGAYGFAATLDVTSDNLAAGNIGVAECDADGVHVSYSTAWDAALNAYEVTAVTVEDIDGCDTDAIQATLTDGTNELHSILEGSVAGDSDATHSFDVAGADVLASAVEGVHVVIDG